MEMTSGKFYGNDGDGTDHRPPMDITVCEGRVFGTRQKQERKRSRKTKIQQRLHCVDEINEYQTRYNSLHIVLLSVNIKY